MNDDPFNIEETPACAGAEAQAEKAVDQLFSDDVESAVLSVVNPTTGQELLKIARQHKIAENDPVWMFAHVLVNNKIIADTYESNTKIVANRAQIAVMSKFEEDSEKITSVLKNALKDAVRASKSDFDKAHEKMIRSIEIVADDFQSRKVGIKKTSIAFVASLILIAAAGGWWLGSNSIQRLKNDEILKNAQTYDHILKRYDELTEQQQQAIDKLLLN